MVCIRSVLICVSVDSKAIDEAASIPEDVLNTVKDLGLFGQQIPVDYGEYK